MRGRPTGEGPFVVPRGGLGPGTPVASHAARAPDRRSRVPADPQPRMGQCASQPRVDDGAVVDAPVDRKLTPSDSADSRSRGRTSARPEARLSTTRPRRPRRRRSPSRCRRTRASSTTTPFAGASSRGTCTRPRTSTTPPFPPVHPDHRLTKEEAESHPLGRFLNASAS